MKEDKKRLKDERRLAKARIRSERAAMAKAKRERGGFQSSLLRQLTGISTKSDRSKKAHEEKLKRQKKARASAGDIASYIGYDAIYKDGIAQVEEGLFSQTIEFSDISYQSARRENQQNIFTVLSSLYNYFGADSCVQLTIANVPIPDDEIGKKRFFKASDPDTKQYVKEYNRILNDKMREGVSNLTRHRYLTYMVGAGDVWEAVPKLSRIKGDVTDTLSRIRCEAHALNGTERLNAIHSQLRPKAAFTFAWDKVNPCSNTRTRDLIAPALVDFKPSGRSDIFRIDETYGCVLSIRTFGSMLEDYYLANIIDLPMPLSVNLHIQPIAQSDALALVKRQLDWMDKEIIDEQMSAMKKGYDYTILPPELRYSKEEAEELLDFLRNKNERLFTYTGLIYTYADTIDALERQVEQIISVGQGNSLGIEPLYYRQRQALNSVLPLGMNHVDVTRYLTTGQIAMQMPFASLELNQEGGATTGNRSSPVTSSSATARSSPHPWGSSAASPVPGSPSPSSARSPTPCSPTRRTRSSFSTRLASTETSSRLSAA